MVRIALISEGVSENKIISYLIQRFLGSECVVNAVQPKLTDSSRGSVQASGGGWSEVLNHCNNRVIDNALSFNDYVVIQIDTDACYHSQFGVCVAENSGAKHTDGEVYADVRQRLLREISQGYHDKILFAVCFNETECWLLPLFYVNDTKACQSTNNCIYRLNQQLKKKGLGVIPGKDKNSANAISLYNKILRQIKKKQDVQKLSQYNYGFMKFVEQLDKVNNRETS